VLLLVVEITEEIIVLLVNRVSSGGGLGQTQSDPRLSWEVPKLFSCCNAHSGPLDSRICSASEEQEASGEKEAFSEASALSRSGESLANKALPAG